ncbi:hypothetical protein ACH5RR_024944, partial [Cinchona calisaya]
VIVAGLVICAICVSCYWSKLQSGKHAFFIFMRKSKDCQNLEAYVTQFGSLAPRRYTYKDIKKMTNSFKDKIGKGGFGDVYRGNLFDNRRVAVKILNSFKGSGVDFINEIASISRTSHVNVVTLLGFCLDGERRALVYEFMPNGSLEKYIYGETKSGNHLGLLKLYDIAVGIARGLEYLHKGCNTRILHFDIKPHNILLDEDFCPKISDFGLAKLCTQKESIITITGARGTVGYIAPELVCRNFGVVSHKSDIYSYGMMLLEMIGGRKNFNAGVSHTSEIYFPHWAYHRMVLDEDLKLQGVFTPEENEIARKMILVGLWCIQNDPSQRPTVSKVIEMLEGNFQALEIPPKPFFDSPSRSPTNSSTSGAALPFGFSARAFSLAGFVAVFFFAFDAVTAPGKVTGGDGLPWGERGKRRGGRGGREGGGRLHCRGMRTNYSSIALPPSVVAEIFPPSPTLFRAAIGLKNVAFHELKNRFSCNTRNGFLADELVASVENCKFGIIVPVLRSALEEFRNDTLTLQELVNQGFRVEYNIDSQACIDCVRSLGLCWSGTNSIQPTCLCRDGAHESTRPFDRGISVTGLGICTICVSLYWRKLHSRKLFFFTRKSKDSQNLEACVTQFGSLAPRRYTYKDIKKMTNFFKDRLGKGRFGDVYKGNLFDNRPVAVKILNSFKGSGEEFINEVASISRSSHVNIVTLLGFCLDGERRALVYEFMPNGSLEKYIYGEKKSGNHLLG